MIRTRVFDFGICFIVGFAAMASALWIVSATWAVLFGACVGGAVYVALRQRREIEAE